VLLGVGCLIARRRGQSGGDKKTATQGHRQRPGPGLPESVVSRWPGAASAPPTCRTHHRHLRLRSRPTVYWVATASGGLLKTSTRHHFEHQFDHEAPVSIGDVCVARPTGHRLVGTGEGNRRNSVSTATASTNRPTAAVVEEHGLKGHSNRQILVSPQEPRHRYYVGAPGRCSPNKERGVYKTTDGGQNWEKVGTRTTRPAHRHAMHPTDRTHPDRRHERRRDEYDATSAAVEGTLRLVRPVVRFGEHAGIYRPRTEQELHADHQGPAPVQDGRIGLDWYRKDPRSSSPSWTARTSARATRPQGKGGPALCRLLARTPRAATASQHPRRQAAMKAGLEIGDVITAAEQQGSSPATITATSWTNSPSATRYLDDQAAG